MILFLFGLLGGAALATVCIRGSRSMKRRKLTSRGIPTRVKIYLFRV